MSIKDEFDIDEALIEEYINAVADETPDLWDRINAGIDEIEKKNNEIDEKTLNARNIIDKKKNNKVLRKKYISFAVAAAIILIVLLPTAMYFSRSSDALKTSETVVGSNSKDVNSAAESSYSSSNLTSDCEMQEAYEEAYEEAMDDVSSSSDEITKSETISNSAAIANDKGDANKEILVDLDSDGNCERVCLINGYVVRVDIIENDKTVNSFEFSEEAEFILTDNLLIISDTEKEAYRIAAGELVSVEY